jgi:hypothetical protein
MDYFRNKLGLKGRSNKVNQEPELIPSKKFLMTPKETEMEREMEREANAIAAARAAANAPPTVQQLQNEVEYYKLRLDECTALNNASGIGNNEGMAWEARANALDEKTTNGGRRKSRRRKSKKRKANKRKKTNRRR